jgi:DNA-binding MarR family transcriptional regulator
MFTAHPNLHLTKKQWQILSVLCTGNGKDAAGQFIPADIDELLERLTYETSKQSMQFSIRALVKSGFITKDYEKRRGARRVILTPTKHARQMMGYNTASYIEPAGEEEILKSLIDIDIKID